MSIQGTGKDWMRKRDPVNSTSTNLVDSVVASAIIYAVVCWGQGCKDREKRRFDTLMDCTEAVRGRRMLARLISIIDITCHLLHETVRALSSSSSGRLHSRKECYCRSFICTVLRLFNITVT